MSQNDFFGDDGLNSTLQAYYGQIHWLYQLITDPTGARYFQEKSAETRQQELRDQLARTADFLDFAGNPQRMFNAIQVAGTSGKGSVVTMLACILTHCGLKTGSHISPYVQICNEKLVVDGQLISPSGFIQLVEEFKQQHAAWLNADRAYSDLRYGEAWVILTYLWLAAQQVDWAVIETGLGGRYDPTNVLPAKLAVITNINYDHVKTLGPTLLDIAGHKAGIIKPDSPVVTTETNPAVLQVIAQEAERQQARLYRLHQDFSFTVHRHTEREALISVQGPHCTYSDLNLRLRGRFQLTNAALAVAALDVLAEKQGTPLSAEAVQAGLSQATIPGRMEIVQHDPPVILDGAHNPHKITALADSLERLYPEKQIVVVIGMIRTKDAHPMIKVLSSVAAKFIATAPVVFGKPALPPSELAHIIKDIAPQAQVETAETTRAAVTLALQQLSSNDLLLVTGSLYLVGEARDYWFPRDAWLKSLERNLAANTFA